MSFVPSEYWENILRPIVNRERPPTIPQAVVIQDNHVLLVKRTNPSLWELPGGGMEAGETPVQTVIREVREETGLLVECIELLGRYTRQGFRAHCALVYLCQPVGGHLRPHSSEVRRVRYFPCNALPRGLFPWYRPIIQQDLFCTASRPLHRTQHLGWRTVFHCLLLDSASRCGLIE
jgi:ADP-ribose pyrophosphatase YjhB (NUDIX family)